MRKLVIMVVAVALLGAALVVLAIPALAQGPNGTPPGPNGNPGGYGWGPGGMMGGFGRGGMMGGWQGGYGPTQGYTPTVPYGNRGWGPGGMMGGFGYGMMGGFGNGYGYGNAPSGQTITLDQAVTAAQKYVASYNNSDLQLAEVEEYAWNFYGMVVEKSTEKGAFQILINKSNGAAYPEMGPNMMWNTKYSPMGWMMGGWFGQNSGAMTVSLEQAHANAEQYIKANLPNTTVEDNGDTFYGYYNFDVLQNGKTYGMLSVNGYTGQVWYHTWHGDYIATKTLD